MVEPLWGGILRRASGLVGAVAVLFAAGFGGAAASETALPGSALFRLKLAKEGMELRLAGEDEARLGLRVRAATRRLEEARLLLQMGGTVPPQLLHLAADTVQRAMGESEGVRQAGPELRQAFGGLLAAHAELLAALEADPEGAAAAAALARVLEAAVALSLQVPGLELELALRLPGARLDLEAGDGRAEVELQQLSPPAEGAGAADQEGGASGSGQPGADGAPAEQGQPAPGAQAGEDGPAPGGEAAPQEEPAGGALRDGEDELKLRGLLQSMSGEVWVVAGVAVRVTAETELDDGLAPGVLVRVEAVRAADGISWLAEEIETDGQGRSGHGPSSGSDGGSEDGDDDEDDD